MSATPRDRLRVMCNPLVRNGHEVALHSEAEALPVLRGLDDDRFRLTCNHTY